MASPRGSAKPGASKEVPAGRAEVTAKATFGLQDVGGDGMSGRQSGVSGETCRLRVRPAGVRAFIVLQRREPREARLAKPGLGKGGRKVET
jgi:hypothetical protein